MHTRRLFFWDVSIRNSLRSNNSICSRLSEGCVTIRFLGLALIRCYLIVGASILLYSSSSRSVVYSSSSSTTTNSKQQKYSIHILGCAASSSKQQQQEEEQQTGAATASSTVSSVPRKSSKNVQTHSQSTAKIKTKKKIKEKKKKCHRPSNPRRIMSRCRALNYYYWGNYLFPGETGMYLYVGVDT